MIFFCLGPKPKKVFKKKLSKMSRLKFEFAQNLAHVFFVGIICTGNLCSRLIVRQKKQCNDLMISVEIVMALTFDPCILLYFEKTIQHNVNYMTRCVSLFYRLFLCVLISLRSYNLEIVPVLFMSITSRRWVIFSDGGAITSLCMEY
jgi:hypothetical protein